MKFTLWKIRFTPLKCAKKIFHPPKSFWKVLLVEIYPPQFDHLLVNVCTQYGLMGSMSPTIPAFSKSGRALVRFFFNTSSDARTSSLIFPDIMCNLWQFSAVQYSIDFSKLDMNASSWPSKAANPKGKKSLVKS